MICPSRYIALLQKTKFLIYFRKSFHKYIKKYRKSLLKVNFSKGSLFTVLYNLYSLKVHMLQKLKGMGV